MLASLSINSICFNMSSHSFVKKIALVAVPPILRIFILYTPCFASISIVFFTSFILKFFFIVLFFLFIFWVGWVTQGTHIFFRSQVLALFVEIAISII